MRTFRIPGMAPTKQLKWWTPRTQGKTAMAPDYERPVSPVPDAISLAELQLAFRSFRKVSGLGNSILVQPPEA